MSSWRSAEELAGQVFHLDGAVTMQPSTPTKGREGWPTTWAAAPMPMSMPARRALSQAQGPEIIMATWPWLKPASISGIARALGHHPFLIRVGQRLAGTHGAGVFTPVWRGSAGPWRRCRRPRRRPGEQAPGEEGLVVFEEQGP